MALLAWEENYSVNIREIDQQHKKLIKIINKVHDNIINGDSKELQQKIINELVEYTVYHFGFEEKLLVKYHYPESVMHMRVHSGLINRVKEFIKKYESGNATISVELMGFLKNWLINHIMGIDKKYSVFLVSKGMK